tara:strand:- start:710 stop:1135 length:426 start_codon:yes stop_codon:yes gene_type:complete
MPISSDKGNFIKPGFDPLAVQTSTNSYFLYSWGTNSDGELGQGNTTSPIDSPVQVGALTTWTQAAMGRRTGLGTTADGKLYAWGSNQYGGLGQGNTTNYSSPVQVGALTTWAKVAATGGWTSFAIKTDGTFWSLVGTTLVN